MQNCNKGKGNKAIKLQGMKRWLESIFLSAPEPVCFMAWVLEFTEVKDPTPNSYYKHIFIDLAGKTATKSYGLN